MKIMNVLTLVTAVSSLLIMSNVSVVAADETKTIIDAEDDVIDVFTGEPSDYQNIDITELIYERDGTNVTVTMIVKGDIENLGDPEDYSGLEDSITYAFFLVTSYSEYSIVYVNNYCVLLIGYDEENITDFSVDGSILKINFNINNTDETYDSLTGESIYMSIDLVNEDYIVLTDTAGDLPLSIEVYVPNLGETGEEIEFIGYSEYGQFPYTYLWDFGDGSTSTEKNPSHIYNKAGTYNVTFTVTDDEGSEESDAGMIEIVGDEDNGTPGFELIIAITAIGLVFLWKRKR